MTFTQLSTPEELKDFCIGKQIYTSGGYLEDCTSEAMRRGFSRMVSQQLFVDWKLFSDEPAQAVRFIEAALEATKTF